MSRADKRGLFSTAPKPFWRDKTNLNNVAPFATTNFRDRGRNRGDKEVKELHSQCFRVNFHLIVGIRVQTN